MKNSGDYQTISTISSAIRVAGVVTPTGLEPVTYPLGAII
jgi:hypothetical protein